MKFLEYVLVVLVILIVALVFIGFVTAVIELEKVREENHMLENALADFGAEIEELSTTVDELRQELSRDIEWNNNIEGF